MKSAPLRLIAESIILGHLHELLAQAESVKRQAASDHLHRMRVSSRRLRNALWFFRKLLPERSYHRYVKKVRRLTRALGRARDLDTHIAFVGDRINKTTSASLQRGLASCRKELIRRRTLTQRDVERALREFPAQDIRKSIERDLHSSTMKTSLDALVKNRIRKRVRKLLRLAPAADNESDGAQLHRIRIASKNLRYTLEHARHLFGPALKPFARQAQALQDTLGDMRNFTIWALDSRGCATKYLAAFCDAGAHRAYLDFSRIWRAQLKNRIWEKLTAALKRPATERSVRAHDASLDSFRQIGEYYRYDQVHARQVAHLSLQLFDQLAGLHALLRHDRLLLEAAAIVHDVGGYFGLKKHHKSSMMIILFSPLLPLLSRRDRLIVALVARYHRRASPDKRHAYYSSLPARDRSTVDSLAALLRLADGLDRTHSSAVKELSCRIDAGSVRICVRGRKELREELEYGKKKADLFEKIFGKKIVVSRSRG